GDRLVGLEVASSQRRTEACVAMQELHGGSEFGLGRRRRQRRLCQRELARIAEATLCKHGAMKLVVIERGSKSARRLGLAGLAHVIAIEGFDIEQASLRMTDEVAQRGRRQHPCAESRQLLA